MHAVMDKVPTPLVPPFATLLRKLLMLSLGLDTPMSQLVLLILLNTTTEMREMSLLMLMELSNHSSTDLLTLNNMNTPPGVDSLKLSPTKCKYLNPRSIRHVLTLIVPRLEPPSTT